MNDRMTRPRKNHSMYTLHEVVQRQDHKCPICGKLVDLWGVRGVDWTVEHIIPYAVFKWVEFNLVFDVDANELWELINSTDNLAITHEECNTDKACKIYSEDDIRKLHLPDSIRELYIKHLRKLEPYIFRYNKVLDYAWTGQGGGCAGCRCRLDKKDAIIRRMNDRTARTMSNAMVICAKCNEIM